MKKFIIMTAILLGLSVSAQADEQIDSIIKSMKMIKSCGEEIAVNNQFTGCSKDIPLMLDMAETGTGNPSAIMDMMAPLTAHLEGNRSDPALQEFLKDFTADSFMINLNPVVLDFMCVTAPGRKYLLASMGPAGTDDATNLMAMAMFENMFCKDPMMGGATLSAMAGL